MKTEVQNIPQELKALPQWVCWVGADKIPKNPATGQNARSNDPKTWGTFEQAVKACDTFNLDGIGFMFANGYFGVDLDHCTDKQDFVDEFVETLQSYTEYSKSGQGIHIICKGTLPDGARRRGNVEMYSAGRYFICTGKLYNPKYTEVRDCTESIKVLHEKYLPSSSPKISGAQTISIDLDDQTVIDKARSCRTGQLFQMLYSGNWQGVYHSQSEADLALCNQLAFWTGKNPEQMDRIFRTSGLMREKWDRKTGESTYGRMTINKAIATTMDVYQPQQGRDDTKLALALFRDGKIGAVDEPEEKKDYDLTDTGNAHRLYDKFGSVLHYSYNRKKWIYWDGKCWRIDDTGEVKKLADLVCEEIKKQAYLEQDEDSAKELLKWAKHTESSKAKEAMVKESQHLEDIPANPDAFDVYPEYLNCANGIVNLRNGELIPHDPNFMMSKICYAEYGEGEPNLWLKFLDDVTNHDKELQEYLQRCVGYSLSGYTSEQCVFFLYGMGNNGKSTFLDTLADVFGTYSSNVQPETIMMKRYGGDGPNSDIARLKSTRFVISEEPTEGVRLNEGLLKQLTGSSRITCRFLYGDEFEYTPEFKIWLATNHKPVVRGTDFGIWRRLKLIPFEVTIPKEKVDKNLKYKLREEFPQILRWAVEGCIKWQKDGIKEPQCVKDATADYKQEMDILAGFLDECIIIDYSCRDRIMARDLFQLYSRWAKQNNEYEMSAKKFGMEMTKKLPDKGKSAQGIYYTDVKLTEAAKDLLNSGEKQYSYSDFYKD